MGEGRSPPSPGPGSGRSSWSAAAWRTNKRGVCTRPHWRRRWPTTSSRVATAASPNAWLASWTVEVGSKLGSTDILGFGGSSGIGETLAAPQGGRRLRVCSEVVHYLAVTSPSRSSSIAVGSIAWSSSRGAAVKEAAARRTARCHPPSRPSPNIPVRKCKVGSSSLARSCSPTSRCAALTCEVV
jgi:hypothetical protein